MCRYVQLEADSAWHMKGTLVSQGEGSSYSLTETCIGGSIARHDVSIAQVHISCAQDDSFVAHKRPA